MTIKKIINDGDHIVYLVIIVCSLLAFICFRWTIDEFYVRFVSVDEVVCSIDLSKVYVKKRNRNILFFQYNYNINGKLYSGSDRLNKRGPKAKNILNGNKDIKLFVNPINKSKSYLIKPGIDTVDDWIYMIIPLFVSGFLIRIVIIFVK